VPERLLRAVVVDDEQLAREELCYVLDEVGGVEVVAEAGNGLEALDAIGRLEPDLVFLDVQMPGLTGFEVARKLADREPPVTVIFVTAYDQHAIQAFEVNAVDYLLKPVDTGRLEQALQRARRRLSRLRWRRAWSLATRRSRHLERIVSMRMCLANVAV